MKDFAKSIRTNNTKVENSSKFDALDSIIQEASMYAENAYRRLNSPYSATNIISDLSHCKQACDIGIKRAQEYDKELQDKERKGRTGNAKVGNYILNLTDQANEYSKGFSEALKKGDKAEAEKFSGYAKILKRQIKEERDEIQKRLKEFDNAERIMGSVGNRKVKNSAVREYKDSEGRIAQIDFNEDGTDADMSIYEDERMTRSVESKNFSTIRDAEQYVQSHGFRRVG